MKHIDEFGVVNFAGLPLSMGRAETMNSAGMHAILAGTRSPFTPSQWQELEQQALIFKYMMAGVPVPPDLLIPLRRNINIFSSLPVAGSTLRSNCKLDINSLIYVVHILV